MQLGPIWQGESIKSTRVNVKFVGLSLCLAVQQKKIAVQRLLLLHRILFDENTAYGSQNHAKNTVGAVFRPYAQALVFSDMRRHIVHECSREYSGQPQLILVRPSSFSR
jgi:hypothetical protein